jgi:hypothetical protein
MENGRKEFFNDHYIIPNTIDAIKAKETVIEWLKRLHHNPSLAEKEFVVVNIKGVSVPFWIVSFEIHTAWKGLVQRTRRMSDSKLGAEYLTESGNFRRAYRWAINARSNICEHWGMARLHEPKENSPVHWDGFPLDSTLSRGRLEAPEQEGGKSHYESREFFEFKYANNVPILGIQIDEEEAMRRAKTHIELYHTGLAQMHADYLIDCRHEIDTAGIQLIHMPFWYVSYIYRPKSMLRFFHKPVEKQVILEGVTSGVLKGELAVVHRDKVWVNAVTTGIISIIFLMFGAVWHTSFLMVSLFFAAVAAVSAYVAMIRLENRTKHIHHVTVEGAQKGNGQVGYA